MKLNSDQQQKLLEKLKALHIHCASCGGETFTVVDKLYELREFNEGNLVIGGEDASVVPLVVLICARCGALSTFSAIYLGLLNTDEKTVRNGEDSGKKR